MAGEDTNFMVRCEEISPKLRIRGKAHTERGIAAKRAISVSNRVSHLGQSEGIPFLHRFAGVLSLLAGEEDVFPVIFQSVDAR